MQISFDGGGNQSPGSVNNDAISPRWANGAPQRLISLVVTGFVEIDGAASRVMHVNQNGAATGCERRVGLDYDGDGVEDFAVFRPGLGTWFVTISDSSKGQFFFRQWGLPGDHPMNGDYTGDGRADLVVWRPSNGNWYICRSELDFDCTRPTITQFGLAADRPISADYDDDGINDLAVWRPSIGSFIYRRSSNGSVILQQWGLPTDIPLLAGQER